MQGEGKKNKKKKIEFSRRSDEGEGKKNLLWVADGFFLSALLAGSRTLRAVKKVFFFLTCQIVGLAWAVSLTSTYLTVEICRRPEY